MKDVSLSPEFSKSHEVSKGWGREIVFANNDEYCGKLLEFKRGAKFSMHFHIQKRESFYILRGEVELWFYDLTNAAPNMKTLRVGDVVHIPRNCPHQIRALQDSVIVEVSTHHEDADSYRILPGNSQHVV